MKLSQTEYKIQRQLADREIQPSAKLWDNIQSELDKKEKSGSKKRLWIKLSAIAALLCLCFLAYKGFQNTTPASPNLVLDQKGIMTHPIKFAPSSLDIVISPAYKASEEKSQNHKPNVESTPSTSISAENNTNVNQNTVSAEKEVDLLLQQANQNLTKAEQDKLLVAEVDNLLNQAIENTKDTEQKELLKSMQVRLLLAEVESEIELTKPPNLKDKIWEAIVSNYSDLKNSVVLN